MSLVTLNGDSVLAGAVTLPIDGAWHAELEVDAASLASGAAVVDIAGGAARFSGTVVRGSEYRSIIRLEVVGGAGKLGAFLPAKAYRNVVARTVLVDALLAAGERLSPASDATVLSRAVARWVRPAGRLRDVLSAVVAGTPGAVWRVRMDGAVWVGVPMWSPKTIAYELLEDDALHRRAEISTDDFASLDAGISLDGRRVLALRHVLGDQGLSTEAYFG